MDAWNCCNSGMVTNGLWFFLLSDVDSTGGGCLDHAHLGGWLLCLPYFRGMVPRHNDMSLLMYMSWCQAERCNRDLGVCEYYYNYGPSYARLFLFLFLMDLHVFDSFFLFLFLQGRANTIFKQGHSLELATWRLPISPTLWLLFMWTHESQVCDIGVSLRVFH